MSTYSIDESVARSLVRLPLSPAFLPRFRLIIIFANSVFGVESHLFVLQPPLSAPQIAFAVEVELEIATIVIYNYSAFVL